MPAGSIISTDFQLDEAASRVRVDGPVASVMHTSSGLSHTSRIRFPSSAGRLEDE